MAEPSPSEKLFCLIDENKASVDDVETSLSSGCEVFYQREATGESLLMKACENGAFDVVKLLLEKGAPWNALDRKGKCAGEYALANGHQEIVNYMVNWGVRAEMVLGAIEQRKIERGPGISNEDYLKSDVKYSDDNQTLVQDKEAVMMEWERPLMKIHAQVICTGGVESDSPSKRDVLNVGFGLGIIDGYIQEFGVKTHTIIEAHPLVYKRMLAQGWDKKPNVTIHFGRWEDVVPKLIQEGVKFDGIFFDTFGEYYHDLKKFHEKLPELLRQGGIYSFFNGLCPRNIFFHGVCCQIVELELKHLGFATEFHGCQVQQSANADETWDGLNRYWWNDTYYLPVATKI